LRFHFAPLTRDDLPRLHRWLAEPHVAQWWGEPEDYLPSIEGTEPSRCYIAHLNGDPIGMLQTYRWADWPKEAAAVGARRDEAGIVYLIGGADLIGRGIGPEMVRAFIEQVVGAAPIRLNVSVGNQRSWRCLEKLGFTREPDPRLIEGEEGPQYVLVYRPSTAR
jgi:RimJ/RimL family protein N-acetyltransferase